MSFRDKFRGFLGKRPETEADAGPGYGLGAEGAFGLPEFPEDPAPPQQAIVEAPEQYVYVGIDHPVPEADGDDQILGI
ncbi:MAG: hypothetical protein KA099_03030 [Alphaproteobacteria bacterium]|nr:hypothetical protein [Alphaproteobacteria bacterium]MBP7759316.1 hypothetical protein [Alphaproteobacteria bacterium]MBP7762529.1 hypothetical protein [Alphaproteobacteria bacterium]MBP7904276.1 hypothetical protein [Alphaproteobacteria bacterium]